MDGAKPPFRKCIRRGVDPAAVGDAIGVYAGDHLRFRQPDARVPCWTGADLPFRDHANVRIAAGNILPAGFEIGRAIVDDDDVISVPGKSLGMQRRQAVVELPPLMQMGADDRYPVRTATWREAERRVGQECASKCRIRWPPSP